jgi:toxin ParE1/3/4
VTFRLRWLPRAVATRRAQIDYIAGEDPRAAERQDERIGQVVANLAAHPRMGRDGREPGTRELVVARTRFVVVYQIEDATQTVSILRVLHGAQQWPLVDAAK